MKKTTLYRAAAATVLGLSLTTGVAAADTTNINHTGYKSVNIGASLTDSSSHTNVKNNVGTANIVSQGSMTGDATVQHNKKGGSASTGDSSNAGAVVNVTKVTNTAPAPAAPAMDPMSDGGNTTDISHTGPKSFNLGVTATDSSTHTSDTNNVGTVNVVSQQSVSGDATVQNNKKGGDATTGSSSNELLVVNKTSVTNN
jgi:hypothetical protein